MRWLALLVTTACYRHAPYAGDGATTADARADAGADSIRDAPMQLTCSAHVMQACVGPPQVNITLVDPTDTNVCAGGVGIDSNAYCLIAADSITVSSHVHVKGSRPLVLAAATIDISGDLDASSELGGTRVGAGSDILCPSGAAAPSGASGGAGGSYGTPGGNGGNGGTGGIGGIAEAGWASTTLAGGCSGENGAQANSISGGPGGGAVWVFAGQQLTITGTVEANGGGGAGGASTMPQGGGGGGSGGLIGLESPSIVVAGATLGANGGGGGGGSISGSSGGDGSDGGLTSAAGGGSGHNGSGTSGAGGDGAFSGNTAQSGGSGTFSGGGGGGGGGEGYIYAYGIATGTPAVVSPAWQP